MSDARRSYETTYIVNASLEDSQIEAAITHVTEVIERNGVEGPINFNVDNLPHGMIVDNIGLNGVLIPDGESRREIFLNARAWVPETTRRAHAVAASADGEASAPITIHVRRDATVAKAP